MTAGTALPSELTRLRHPHPAGAGIHPPERTRAVSRPRPNPERTGINQTERKAEKTLAPKSLDGDPPHRPHQWDETPTRNPSRS